LNSHYPPDHPFGHFIPSDAPENIYYADLFRIKDRNWMIQGYGKSTAARIAFDKKTDAMYATDTVGIIRDGNTLFGRYDPGALTTKDPDLCALHKIDAIAYCLDEKQTINEFEPRGGAREIVEADSALLSTLCATYSYPPYMAPYFFTPEALAYFSDPLRMKNRFIELTQGAVGTKFLIVPHMPTTEEKAALYCNFIF